MMSALIAASVSSLYCMVGSYTDATHPRGLHIVSFDPETGAMAKAVDLDVGRNPTYMACTPDTSRFYVPVGRPAFGAQPNDGGLVAFERKGLEMKEVDAMGLGIEGIPCHVGLSADGRILAWAEYVHGYCGMVDLDAGGRFRPETLRKTRHAGFVGPNKPRQDRPHAHFASFSPDGRYLFVVDLGQDRIVAYDVARRAEGMVEVPRMTLRTEPAGAGPRHFVFSKDGRFMYVLFELDSLVASYAYTPEGFRFVTRRSLLPEGFSGTSKASAIKLSADGLRLFGSNRGYDSIAAFDADAATGRLALKTISTFNGAFPRDFAFAPGEKTAIVGLENSHKIASAAYDAKTGAFMTLKFLEDVYRPVYFQFLK